MPTLNGLLLERKKIEDDILKKESEINGTSLDSIRNEIDVLVSKRFTVLSNMDYLQKKARNNNDKEELSNINTELIKSCTELSELDNEIKEKQNDLKYKEKKLFSKSENTKREELVKLYENLSDNTEKVGKKREEERLLPKRTFDNQNGYEQIWIDETIGAYIWYNKQAVIQTTIKDFFNYASKIDPIILNNAGYTNGIDSLYSSISNPNLPGLPALLSMGIDVLIKTIGTFVKNFIAIKNAIDMLAGLDIAEIIGTCIPAAIKIMEDIKLFLSDTPAWMFKNTLSPIFDLNIPIPAFSFDLGSIIPALPFMVNIPKIDNLDFFTKLTPISIKCGDTDVDKDWYSEKPKDSDKISDINSNNYNDILYDLQNKINKLNSEISELNKSLNINNSDIINKITDEIKNRETLLCLNNSKLSDAEIDNVVNIINDLYNKKKDYEKSPEINIEFIKKEIGDREIKIKVLETKKKTLLKVIASSLSVSKNISDENANTVLDSLLKIGVNVNDNNNILYIQKIGYNFKNDDHIEKLKNIKLKGIDISDTKLLKRLFDVGFNINNPSYIDDLNNMNKYKIDISNTEILYMLYDIGFSLNNKNIFSYLKKLSESNINISDFDTIYNINNIGFNFNNPLSVERLYELSGLVNLADNTVFDILIQKNINLNNPYISTILKLYNSIGITIGGVDMKQNEDIIFNKTDYKKIEKILNLINLFKINDYSYRTKYYTTDLIATVSSFGNLGLTGSIVLIAEKELTNKGYLSIYTVKDIINQYSEYGLEFTELVNRSNSDTIKTTASVYSRFEMYKDYVKNKKFVINGNNINETVTEDDMKKLAELYGFSYTNNINTKENEINSVVLGSVFGNFDKIGLNSKDPDFKTKIKSFTGSFNLKIDEIAVLDTKKKVYMETKLKKNKLGGYTKGKTNKIDLSNTKIDPELLEDGSAVFITENVLESGKPVVAKTIAKFDSINKMGFNYQQPDYAEKINVLKKYGYDISHYDTPAIIDNLSSLGFHFTDASSIKNLDLLGTIGFKFSAPKTKSKITLQNSAGDFFSEGQSDTETQYTETVISANIGLLMNIGFNFNKTDYKKMLSFLKTIGVNISSVDCQEALNEINSFGINFNDNDWEKKCEFFKKLNVNFSISDWNDKMANIRHLGLDFNGSKWLDNYNTITDKQAYGLDFNDTQLRKKLSILSGFGVEFTESPDNYKEKVEALIDLGLVSLSSDLYEQRKNEYNNYLNKRKSIEAQILIKTDELNDKDIDTGDNYILKIESQNIVILNEISSIKQLLSISQNKKTLETYRLKLIESCTKLSDNELKLKELQNGNINKRNNKNYNEIQKEIDILKLEYDSINKPKPYKKDGYRISINELEKLQRFDEMNISFLKDNWISDINELLKNGMDFSKKNWEEKSWSLKNLIQPCPQLAWLKMIKNVLKSVITSPVNIIFGLVKQLLNLVKSIVSLPLNPVKIPDFAKTIISNFKGFIKMMMKLPSLKGITDFLFLDLNGLKIIDMFLPGFANFFGKVQAKNKNCSGGSNDSLNEKLKTLKLQLSAKKLEKENKSEDANDAKNINLSIINNTEDDYLTILMDKRDNINNNMTNIKDKSKNEKNKETLKSLESEIIKLCSGISEIDILINDYKANKGNITPNEAQKNINDIDTQLNKDMADIDAKIRNIGIDIKKAEAELKSNGCSKCFCCMSDSEASDMFKDLANDVKNKNNDFVDKLKDNENKIKKLEEKLNNNVKIKSNNDINDEISKKEAVLCLNDRKISDIEKDKLISEINDLYNYMKEMDNNIYGNGIDINAINKQIDELKKENSKLKEESDKFEKEREIDLINLEGIIKFIPVVKNVICSTPKFIANIIIGIFNSAGYMKNLPTLWEFPLIE